MLLWRPYSDNGWDTTDAHIFLGVTGALLEYKAGGSVLFPGIEPYLHSGEQCQESITQLGSPRRNLGKYLPTPIWVLLFVFLWGGLCVLFVWGRLLVLVWWGFGFIVVCFWDSNSSYFATQVSLELVILQQSIEITVVYHWAQLYSFPLRPNPKAAKSPWLEYNHVAIEMLGDVSFTLCSVYLLKFGGCMTRESRRSWLSETNKPRGICRYWVLTTSFVVTENQSEWSPPKGQWLQSAAFVQ